MTLRSHSDFALVKVTNGLFTTSDSGFVFVLVFFDLSAALDTINRKILINRLEQVVGIRGMALKQFE